MKLSFRPFDLRLARTWTIARGSSDSFTVVFVQLEVDGVVGLGEASPIARYGESSESVQAFLTRVDTRMLDLGNLPQASAYIESVAPGNMAAKCAVNTALFDAAAKQARKPIHDLVGLRFRENHHVTSFSIGIDQPEVVREKVLEAGDYPILKLKVGVDGDQALLHALREVAADKPVRVDANEGWKTRDEALSRIEWLASDGNIEFVEQPMPAETDPADLAWLKERSPLPLFADESYHAAADIERCLGCFHGVNVKLVKAGGIGPGFEALKAARAHGLKTMLGCMIESSVLISAGAHLSELCDHLDLDGNLLITNDPFQGIAVRQGRLSFADASEPFGLRVSTRKSQLA